MSILDDLRNVRKTNDELISEINKKWKQIIPDVEAEKIADDFFDKTVLSMKSLVANKSFHCDIGAFKKKKNFRYECSDSWLINEELDFYEKKISPIKDFYYLIFDDGSDYNPKKIICGNKDSVAKIYKLICNKLIKEGFKASYEIKKSSGYSRPGISFKCMLPCNEKGDF